MGSEPYLGASIIPTLTDTGATATAFDATTHTLTIEAPGTSIIANHLLDGAKLYTGGCSMISDADNGGTQKAADMITDTSLIVNNDHDCTHDGFTSAIYRRSDDPSNQNLYKTADTAVATDAIMTIRGSSDVYIVTGAAQGAGVKSFTIADSKFEIGAIGGATQGEADAAIFVDAASGGKALADFNNAAFTGANYLFPLHLTKAASVAIAAGDILALNGRRYKVKTGAAANGRVTLTETFAGGQLLELCSNCVTATGDYSDAANSIITVNKALSVNLGDQLLVGGYVHADTKTAVATATSAGGTHTTGTSGTITMSAGSNNGVLCANTAGATCSALAAQTRALFREINTNGYVGSKVTEVATAAPFQYVSQCSNRGTCDSATGVCKCFKGYSNDNCDNQNMLAM